MVGNQKSTLKSGTRVAKISWVKLFFSAEMFLLTIRHISSFMSSLAREQKAWENAQLIERMHKLTGLWQPLWVIISYSAWKWGFCEAVHPHQDGFWYVFVGRRFSVVMTSVFGWRTFSNLCLIYGWHVTTLWVSCPLCISQIGQLSLSSLQGR